MWLFYLLCLTLIQFALQQDSKDDYLLVANTTSIFKFNETSYKTTLIVQLPKDNTVKALDYSYNDRLLFWLNKLDSSINVHNVDTGRKINLFRNQQISPNYIAIDWITKKIYWIGNEPYRIEVSDYSGSNSSLILMFTNQIPKCIALAPLDGLLFWSDNEADTINRISMNGDETTHKRIVSNTRAFTISVDHNVKKIYWNDIPNKLIRSADFNGQHLRDIQSSYTPTVAFFNGNVYYSDLVQRAILSLNPIGGKKKQLISYQESPPLLAYFSQQNQPKSAQVPCSINNGGCSHLCLLSSERPFYSCACPNGIPLSLDNKTCKSFPDQFLLLAFINQLNYISLDTKDFLPKPTRIRNQEKITAVDFDPIDQRIYWIDKNQIKSAFLNGSDELIVTQCELEYERLRIDATNRNIYLVKNSLLVSKDPDRYRRPHSSNFSIEVVRLDGKFKKTLIDDQIDNPRAIAIDERNGFFYWSDWSKTNPKIEKVSFDLKYRKKIITKDIAWPNGIVVDHTLKRLYWCDAKLSRIEYSDLHGSNRQTLIKLNLSLLDLTILGDYIYFIDSLKDQIGRVHKLTGRYEIVSNRNQKLSKIMGFKVVSNLASRPDDQQVISLRRSCSQLSLSPDLCACSNGYVLQNDNITCLLGNDTCELNHGDCQQKCDQIIGSYYKCSCEEGFALDYNQKSCALIASLPTPEPTGDACDQVPRPCSHDCISILNEFHCRCPNGMSLNKNGTRCFFHLPNEPNDQNISVTSKQVDEISTLAIVMISFLTILMAVFLILAAKCVTFKRKEAKFQNSRENIIQSGGGNQLRLEHSHSLSNVENSILYDRSVGVGASVLDENRHSMDPPSPDNMSSVTKWQHQIPKFDLNNLRFIHQSTNFADLDDLHTNTSLSIGNLDDAHLSNADLMTNVNSCIYVPPPTPLLLNDEDELNDHNDDRIYNLRRKDNRHRANELNSKDELISRDFMYYNNNCSSPLDVSVASDRNYFPIRNPPNSLSSSINNLVNLNVRKYDDI